MTGYLKRICYVGAIWAIFTFISSCQTDENGLPGNEGGSTSLNEREAIEYKKALLRCYKSGGTRIVKIMGQLRCY